MNYALGSSIATEVNENWKILFEFDISGTTTFVNQLFDVVINILINPVNDINVIDRAPFVDEINYRKTFTASSGTTLTIVSNNLNEKDQHWQGGSVQVIDGTNKGEVRTVSNFTLKTLTVPNAFTAAIDSTSECTVVRSFQKELDEAFRVVQDDLRNMKIKLDRVLESTQVFELILLQTIHLICFNFMRDPVDVWAARADSYKEKYLTKLSSSTFDYDADQSGNIDPDEEDVNLSWPDGER
jgi:hypothetical protein